MNRTEFVIATAIILFVAFLLGWFANWLVHRLTRVSQADLSELDRMAQATHEAEEARDQAIEYLQYREGEMMAQMHELETALNQARAENEELRGYLEDDQARA